MPTTDRSTMAALYAGLALSLVALVAPFLDRGTTHVIADHVRDGYPAYGDGRVDDAVTTWLVVLGSVGIAALLCWSGVIWALRSGKAWARPAATLVFVVGASVEVYALLARDTSGDTGLPMQLGILGVLPCLAGLVAVVLMWRARPS